MAYFITFIIGYILGSLNLAVLLGKRKGVDVITGGSANPGASNTTILLGWWAGISVGLHDIGKALLATFIAGQLFPNTEGIKAVAGASCVVGHIFSVFLKFKGGKGFASYIGLMLALNWKFALIILAAVVFITVLLDYLTIGTTFTVISLPVFLAVTAAGWIAITAVCIATAVIIFKHKENYIRIVKGTEFGLRSTIKGEHRVK